MSLTSADDGSGVYGRAMIEIPTPRRTHAPWVKLRLAYVVAHNSRSETPSSPEHADSRPGVTLRQVASWGRGHLPWYWVRRDEKCVSYLTSSTSELRGNPSTYSCNTMLMITSVLHCHHTVWTIVQQKNLLPVHRILHSSIAHRDCCLHSRLNDAK